MKVIVAAVVTVAATLLSNPSFAGWGAIACDVKGSGACGVSYGWPNLRSAESYAIKECNKGGYRCYIYRWEHNLCIRGPNGSYTCR